MGMGKTRSGAALVLLLALACSEPEVRPPVAGDCNEPPCNEVRASATTTRAVALLPEPGAGQAGSSGNPPPPSTALQGSVRMIVEPDLFGTDPPNAPVEIRAAGVNGTVVAASPSADGSFSLPGVAPQERAWVAVGNFTDLPGDVFMDTYQQANTAAQQPVELAVMQVLFAPPEIAVQVYHRAVHPTMLAKLFTGQSVDQVIIWARGELEGFIR